MAVRTTAQLKAFNNANIDANGVNNITGPIHNKMDDDIIDSMINRSTDALLIVTNVYRSDSEAITTSDTQITFSTPLSSNVYQIDVIDNLGIGFEEPFDKQTTGFKIKGLSNGTIGYFVILTN